MLRRAPVRAARSSVVYIAFFLSGAAALIYQTIWVKTIGLFLGTTIQAIGIVTATFMGGLALGGALFGRVADRSPRLFRLYAAIEIAVAVSAVVLAFLSPHAGRVFSALAAGDGSEKQLYLFRILGAVLMLAVPCVLIGGTLPVMARAVVRALPQLGSRVGLLYAVNTLGAAAGVLLATFVLVEAVGVRATVFVAAALNVVVAILALSVARAPDEAAISAGEPVAPSAHVAATPRRFRVGAAAAFFMSGAAGLALEVLWTRILFGFISASVVAFASILACILVGLAGGGLLGAWIADRTKAPLAAAGVCFAAVAALTSAGASQLGVFILTERVSFHSPYQLLAIIGMVVPAATAMGVLFPILIKVLVRDVSRLASDLGAYYALNTLGTIAGSLGASFVAIPLLGVSRSVVAIVVINTVAGLALLLLERTRTRIDRKLWAGLGVAVALTLVTAPFAATSYRANILRRAARSFPGFSTPLVFIEEADSTVALYRRADGVHRLQVNSSPLVAFHTDETKLMAHLPLFAVESPQRALVICFGMGNTFRSALSHGIATDVVDINPSVPPLTRFTRTTPSDTLAHPRGRIIVNDGRNFLLVTDKKYDMITVDPAPPIWGIGMVNLHTKEFFELARSRLREGGVMNMWALSNEGGDFKMTLKAFLEVFPHVEVFTGLGSQLAFNVLGSMTPIRFSESRIRRALEDPRIRADIDEKTPGFLSVDLLSRLYRTDGETIAKDLEGVPPLTDDAPRLEYRLFRREIPEYTVPERLRRPLVLLP